MRANQHWENEGSASVRLRESFLFRPLSHPQRYLVSKLTNTRRQAHKRERRSLYSKGSPLRSRRRCAGAPHRGAKSSDGSIRVAVVARLDQLRELVQSVRVARLGLLEHGERRVGRPARSERDGISFPRSATLTQPHQGFPSTPRFSYAFSGLCLLVGEAGKRLSNMGTTRRCEQIRGTYSASRRARPPRRSRRHPCRSTAPCSARTRPSTNGSRSRVSRRRCARSATRRLRDVVDRYVPAWERNDVEAVVAMLTEDATMTMPPLPTSYRGREEVAVFLGGWPLAGVKRWRPVSARANGQLAFGAYVWDEEMHVFMPHGVKVLTAARHADRGDHRPPQPRRLPRLRPPRGNHDLTRNK